MGQRETTKPLLSLLGLGGKNGKGKRKKKHTQRETWNGVEKKDIG